MPSGNKPITQEFSKKKAYMLKEDGLILNCRQCGKDFVFSEAEQEFYKEKGFDLPRRCKECRSNERNRANANHFTCSKCGNDLEEGVTVYCDACLKNIENELENKIKKMQEKINRAQARIRDIETEKTELEKNVSVLSQDLEKVNQLHSSLNYWFQPTLNGIEQRLVERLETLEHGQNKINERMLQLVEKIHDMYRDTTIFDIIKHSFKHHQEQGRQTA
jgi:DNA repair exonuclease SbcCD ATPase subunit